MITLLLLSALFEQKTASAAASEFRDAERGVARAYNDFYRSARSERDLSDTKIKSLTQKHLDPADSAMTVQTHRESLRALSSAGVRSVTSFAGDTNYDSSSDFELPDSILAALGTGGASGSSSGVTGFGRSSTGSSQGQALDGSKIEREVTFPGVSYGQ